MVFIDKMIKNRLRYFGHVMKRDKSEAIRMVININIIGKEKKEDKNNKVGCD